MRGKAWRRVGRVLEAFGGPFSATHAMLPTPIVAEGVVRVLFTSCDDQMRGRIFSADFAPEPPFSLLNVTAKPVLDLGEAGEFDCDGVNPSQLIWAEGELLLLYIGWRRGPAETPYSLIAGLARSQDGGRSFRKDPSPLLPPITGEQLFRTAPFVSAKDDGYQMLYIGGDAFFDGPEGKRLPTYGLRRLHSTRADRWSGPAEVLLEPNASRGEIGFGRPIAFGEEGNRLMVSIRTVEGYELVEGPMPGDASRRTALRPVFAAPFEPWESDMRCFGAPCSVGGYELLFYNGNGFGRSGMGLAWRPHA